MNKASNEHNASRKLVQDPNDLKDKLHDIFIDLYGETVLRPNAAEAEKKIFSLIQNAKIDELERLSHQKWADLAYDIPGYLKDRISALKSTGGNRNA